MERIEYIKKRIYLFGKKLVPPEEAAGIEITENYCRLLLLDPETLEIVSIAEVILGQNVISYGKVQDFNALISNLKTLKDKAGVEFSNHPTAILSLNPSIFFTDVISIPDIPESDFEEAARLNATVRSPFRIQDAYFDWQNLGINLKTLERELYIAACPKDIINPYLIAANRAGIDIIAIEPTFLGIIRVFNHFTTALDRNVAFLLIYINSDGIDFIITEASKPIFSYFVFWKDIPETKAKKVTIEALRKVMHNGISRVLSFFSTRYTEPLKNCVIFSPIMQTELVNLLKNEFAFKVEGYRFPTFNKRPISELWVGALGAALRGIIPRSEDTIVSLMPIGTEELFRRNQIAKYISFWGKVFAVTFSLFIAVFSGIFALSQNLRNSNIATLEVLKKSEQVLVAREFESKAMEFNNLVSLALLAESRQNRIDRELEKIAYSAKDLVRIKEMSILMEGRRIRLIGFAPDRRSVLNFKQKLQDSGIFSKIELPVELIRDIPGGVEFTINMEFLPPA
jgi:hypothetical protein